MNYADYINSGYQRTLATSEEERELECRREGCDSPIDETKHCSVCEQSFCPVHLYAGMCADCFGVDEAAEEVAA